jgi:hypothetical protein
LHFVTPTSQGTCGSAHNDKFFENGDLIPGQPEIHTCHRLIAGLNQRGYLRRTVERDEWFVTGSELDRQNNVRRQYPLTLRSRSRLRSIPGS